MTKPAPAQPLHTDVIAHSARINDGKIVTDVLAVTSPGEEFAQVAVIAAAAWERVRPTTDPPFAACSPPHRERLIAEVEGILKSGAPLKEAATPFTDAVVEIVAAIKQALDTQRPLIEGETK